MIKITNNYNNNYNAIIIIQKKYDLSLTELDPSSAAAFPHWMATAIHCSRVVIIIRKCTWRDAGKDTILWTVVTSVICVPLTET